MNEDYILISNQLRVPLLQGKNALCAYSGPLWAVNTAIQTICHSSRTEAVFNSLPDRIPVDKRLHQNTTQRAQTPLRTDIIAKSQAEMHSDSQNFPVSLTFT